MAMRTPEPVEHHVSPMVTRPEHMHFATNVMKHVFADRYSPIEPFAVVGNVRARELAQGDDTEAGSTIDPGVPSYD